MILSRIFSDPYIYQVAKKVFNICMYKKIKDIRKDNLSLLEKEFKNRKAFADRVGTDPAYISQIFSKKTKANVGDDLAEKIEKELGLPKGWMDSDHSAIDVPFKVIENDKFLKETAKNKQLYLENSLNFSGRIPHDSSVMVRKPLLTFSSLGKWLSNDVQLKQDVNLETIEQNVGNVDFVIEMNDDSMEPRIYKGSMMSCVKTDRAENGWFVIAETQQGNFIAREVYQDGDQLKLRAQRPGYDTRNIDDCKIVARIVGSYTRY